MRNTRNIISTVLALIAAISIPLYFTNMESVNKFFMDIFPLEVDKRYTGGEVSAWFKDAYGDDDGEGTLKYPVHSAWQTEGTLDLLRYVVHEPVTDGKWTSRKVFQQIDLSFAGFSNPLDAPTGFSNPVIHIYIDIDGNAGGSLETQQPGAEFVRFSPDAPWDFMIAIDGFSRDAELSSFDGSCHAGVSVYSNSSINTISIRLPLEEGGLMPILDGRDVRHYVLIGAYSQLAQGNFMNVKNKSTARISPRVFDYLAPPGTDQHKMLSSYDRSSNTYAMLTPVIVTPGEGASGKIAKEKLEKLRQLAEKERAEARVPSLQDILDRSLEGPQLVAELFSANYLDEAEKTAAGILEKDPKNGAGLAYMGSIIAIRGGEASSVVEAANLVQKAYELFDEASKYTQDDQQRLDLYMNRGNVALSVPETVFLKSLGGAEDFTKAAEIFLQMGPENTGNAGSALIRAGMCYERAGKPVKAELSFQRAASLKGLSAADRYELALRGFTD